MPSWLLDETDEDFHLSILRDLARPLEEMREKQSFQLKQLKERLDSYQRGKLKRILPVVSNPEEKRMQRVESDDEELLLDTVIPAASEEEDPPISITKVFYCSRTHSQLNQVFNEFLRSAWSKEMHCSLLGGRRALCVHPR